MVGGVHHSDPDPHPPLREGSHRITPLLFPPRPPSLFLAARKKIMQSPNSDCPASLGTDVLNSEDELRKWCLEFAMKWIPHKDRGNPIKVKAMAQDYFEWFKK